MPFSSVLKSIRVATRQGKTKFSPGQGILVNLTYLKEFCHENFFF